MCDWGQVNLLKGNSDEMDKCERELFDWATSCSTSDFKIISLGLFVAVLMRIHEKHPHVAKNMFVRRVNGSLVCAARKTFDNRGICMDIVDSEKCAETVVAKIQLAEPYEPFGDVRNTPYIRER